MDSDRRNREVAAEIRAELGRQGITRLTLSAATSINKNTLRRRLLGETSFTLPELEAISAFLGVPLSQLTARRDAA